MDEIRFDGRTAIVTGAGGNPSLGRAHALLLASRGANVVVNDIGVQRGLGTVAAQGVVDEIVAAGGKAVADTNSVATLEGADAIVKTAMDAFGGVDILVNNAGVIFNVPFDELRPEHSQLTIDVNLMGPIWLSRAVWPHMKARGYGRIVNISSGSLFGLAQQAAYAASKGGMFSLTRALAAEGERFGIKVNSVAPAGLTRMVMNAQEEDCLTYQASAQMRPEQVSPVVAYLSHDDCAVTGVCFSAMGGSVQEIYAGITPGIADPDLTIEVMAARLDEARANLPETMVPHAMFDAYSMHNRPYAEQAA